MKKVNRVSRIVCQEAEPGVTEAEPKDAACPKCGAIPLYPGCDGDGRVIGGLGAIPLFEWWPIKAYRPCPKFIDRGGFYQRSGQGLDEIAFGRDSTFDARN